LVFNFSEGLIKKPNALLLAGVLQQDGSIHHYIVPLQVPLEMQQLCDWVNANFS
jgi:hypothetical protein